MAASDRLYVGRRRHRGHPVITATGELTRNTVLQLRSALLQTLAQSGPHLVLDMTGVSRVDDVGLEALQRTAARARIEGGDLHVAVSAPAVIARMRSTGVAWRLSMHRTLSDAVAAATPYAAADSAHRRPATEVMAGSPGGNRLAGQDPHDVGDRRLTRSRVATVERAAAGT